MPASTRALQPGGEPIPGRADVADQIGEAGVAEDQFADHQQRPAIADQFQGGRHRAGPAGQLAAGRCECRSPIQGLHIKPTARYREAMVGIPNRAIRRPWLALAVVVAAVFMTNLDLWIVNVALPSIGAGFGRDGQPASLSALSWVLNGYAVGLAALLIVAGRLGDRIGHRRVFLLGVAAFTVASALCALRPRPAGAGGCAGAAGRRRCGAVAHLAGPADGRGAGRAAHRGGPRLGCGRCAGSGGRAGARRPAGRAELAVDLRGEPADRTRLAADRTCGAAASAGPGA